MIWLALLAVVSVLAALAVAALLETRPEMCGASCPALVPVSDQPADHLHHLCVRGVHEGTHVCWCRHQWEEI